MAAFYLVCQKFFYWPVQRPLDLNSNEGPGSRAETLYYVVPKELKIQVLNRFQWFSLGFEINWDIDIGSRKVWSTEEAEC
jgi:hypothetical protein